jgi:hypothetical protein
VALPDALVEIKQSAGLLFEVRVSRKDPATLLPRADRILSERHIAVSLRIGTRREFRT